VSANDAILDAMVSKAVIAVIVTATSARADVDWAKGLVTADGIGVANRSAPTPAAARGPARRLAEEAARKKLAAQLGPLPVATGGTLDAKLKDAATKAAVDKAVANAIVVAAEPETDGSWRVTMAVPIEALRLAIAGPRVVEAGAKPAIGYKVGGVAAATVFVKDVPAWAKTAPRVKAKGAKAGVIDATSEATEATLFVLLSK
jgi:hypothetical protein